MDGHLRVELAISRGEPTVPVVYVELSEEEERLVLASLDLFSPLIQSQRHPNPVASRIGIGA